MEDAVDDDMTFATVHVLGQAFKDSVNEDVIKGLKDHFNGECGEVGMYLAMARQADREGYPEIAEAYKRYAYEEADHASRFAELLGEVWVIPRAISRLVLQQRRVLVKISSALPSLLRSRVQMLSTIPFMRWLRMKPATVQVLQVSTRDTSSNRF